MNAEKEKSTFTIMEIFIVLVILGIVSAIVVPKFSRASEEAHISELMSDLQMMRSQIELYRIQHDELLPGQFIHGGDIDPDKFVEDLTVQTDDGLGPYVKKVPRNVFNGLDTIVFVNDPDAVPDCKMNTGWWFNAATGEFRANDCTMNTNY